VDLDGGSPAIVPPAGFDAEVEGAEVQLLHAASVARALGSEVKPGCDDLDAQFRNVNLQVCHPRSAARGDVPQLPALISTQNIASKTPLRRICRFLIAKVL
jgi:hypothetical protein